jgi:hypothetical protein
MKKAGGKRQPEFTTGKSWSGELFSSHVFLIYQGSPFPRVADAAPENDRILDNQIRSHPDSRLTAMR